MRHKLELTLAAVLGLGSGTVALGQDQVIGRDNESDRRAQQDATLDNVARQRQQEIQSDGNRQVQVPEKAIWGLSELPPELMHDAMEQLTKDPAEARLSVMQAANILQLHASLGRGASSQNLNQAAEELRELAMRIERKEVATKDQLRQPFASAAMAAASSFQESAQQGLQRNDEEQTGYSLKGAAEYLAIAHTFAQREPSQEVSRASYDAVTVADQIIKLSKPTTYDAARGGANDRANRGADDARQAGARRDSTDQANIPRETDRIIESLGQAIQQAAGQQGNRN